jgi:phosphonoacetate hydrolase
MEDPSFLRHPTRFSAFEEQGESSIALVAKEKLERMVGRGCSITASAENPPSWLTDAVGEAPGIYSGEASSWLLDAAGWVAEHKAPDWLYVSTTDVIPHKHAPDEPEAVNWLETLDTGLGALDAQADMFFATADHGMRDKSLAVDLESVLTNSGINAVVIRLIRDKHVYHHQNLGGSAYVYLEDQNEIPEAIDLLAATDGVESVLEKQEAADAFSLPTDRIGDLMILGTEQSVFGPVEDETHESVELRSHGSHHEQTVPYVSSVDVAVENNLEAITVLEAI